MTLPSIEASPIRVCVVEQVFPTFGIKQVVLYTLLALDDARVFMDFSPPSPTPRGVVEFDVDVLGVFLRRNVGVKTSPGASFSPLCQQIAESLAMIQHGLGGIAVWHVERCVKTRTT